MRRSPTLARTLAVATLLGTVAWLGCGSTSTSDDGEEPPASGAPRKAANEPDRPTFDASFDEPADSGAPDDSGGGTETCADPDDPGGSETVAKALPPTDDCDNSLKSVSGVANGAVDVDFYKLSALDKFGCSLDTTFGSTTPGLELCVYARCKNNTANAVTGCAAGTKKTSAIGLVGCCTNTPGDAIPEWDCSGISDDDSADFFIRVQAQGGAAACLPYKVSYRY